MAEEGAAEDEDADEEEGDNEGEDAQPWVGLARLPVSAQAPAALSDRAALSAAASSAASCLVGQGWGMSSAL